MKKIISIVLSLVFIFVFFAGCSSNTSATEASIINSIDTIDYKNRQYIVKNILQHEIPSDNQRYYNYTNTNGDKYLNNIYYLKNNPDEIENNDYENDYYEKYSYLYLNGDPKNSSIQVQKYIREEIGDEPSYDYQVFFIKGFRFTDKIEAYHSYDVYTDGTHHDDEYFSFSYDNDGKLTEYLDDTASTYYFYYDEENMLSSRTYDPIETYDYCSFSYEKDENGNIVNVTKIGDYEYTYKYKYEYDSKNQIIRATKYYINKNSEELLKIDTTYSYYDNGNVSSITTKTYKNETNTYDLSTESYSYTKENNISQIIKQTEDKTRYIVFEYTSSPTAYTESQEQ